MFLFRYAGAFGRVGHRLDLSELRFLKAKEHGHLNDLGWADEVFRVGAELFDHGSKLAATHSFRNIKAESAFALPVL